MLLSEIYLSAFLPTTVRTFAMDAFSQHRYIVEKSSSELADMA